MDAFAEAVQDACAILDEVNEWQLPSADWAELSPVIEQLAAAFTAGDPLSLCHWIEELDLYTPERAIPLGSDRVAAPMPAPLRERVNRIVHILGGRSAASERVSPARR